MLTGFFVLVNILTIAYFDRKKWKLSTVFSAAILFVLTILSLFASEIPFVQDKLANAFGASSVEIMREALTYKTGGVSSLLLMHIALFIILFALGIFTTVDLVNSIVKKNDNHVKRNIQFFKKGKDYTYPEFSSKKYIFYCSFLC